LNKPPITIDAGDQGVEAASAWQNTCALCNQGVETISHLLLDSVSIREVWASFLQFVGWEALVPIGLHLCGLVIDVTQTGG
jgi:hypothetical protein